MTHTDENLSPIAGVLFGLGAYLAWGVVPLYFNVTKVAPPILVLSHRIIWSVLFLVVLISLLRQWQDVKAVLDAPRVLLAMIASTLMIACNWYTFIWCITNHRAVDASFGYFINPLVNILLGLAVLKETLRPAQVVAVGFATLGVGLMTAAMGTLPIPSLLLAVSFGFYALIRKTAPVRPLCGLFIETMLLLPVAAAYVVLASGREQGVFHWGTLVGVLLLLGGIVTALPLIWFAAAARRLPLATIGLLQYLSPTCQLLIALTIFHEPFDRWRLLSFGVIWIGLGIFTFDALRRFRRVRLAAVSAEVRSSRLAVTTPSGARA